MCSNEGPCPFLREDNYEKAKYIDESKKSPCPEPLGQFQPDLAQCILGWWGLTYVPLNGPIFFQEEIITKSRKYIDKI